MGETIYDYNLSILEKKLCFTMYLNWYQYINAFKSI